MQHAMQIHVNVIAVSPVQMQHAMQTVSDTNSVVIDAKVVTQTCRLGSP